MRTDDENPYRSPASDADALPMEPVRLEQLPMEFLRGRVTVDQYDAWGEAWYPEEHRGRITHARIRQLFSDGPYIGYALWSPRSQTRLGGTSLFHLDGRTSELCGMNDFFLHPDGTVTGRDYGDYPWPRYRFTLEGPYLMSLLKDAASKLHGFLATMSS